MMRTSEEKVNQNGSTKSEIAATTEVATAKVPRKRIPAKDKKPVATTPKKKDAPKALTFEEKKERYDQMYELTKKYDKLKATRDKLETLMSPKTPLENNLTLYIREGASSGNYVADSDFRTSNTMVILHGLQFLKGKIDEYLKSLKEDILETSF